jgi:hypothetical protein
MWFAASTYLGRIPYLGIDNVADVGYIRCMAQATKGGEIGLNGEFYKGGQFVAGSETTIKGMQNGAKVAKPRKLRKIQIALGVYEIQPSPDHGSIFGMVGMYLAWDVFGQTIKPFVPACEYLDKCKGFELGTTEAEMAEHAAAWNRGERWMMLS